MVFAVLVLTTAACELSRSERAPISVRIQADGKTQTASIPSGHTVLDALQSGGVAVGSLDKVEPPAYTVVEQDTVVRVIRVEERFRTELRTIPFQRQVLRNDALPQGEERLVQAGENGQEELTFRAILEDGALVSETPIKSVQIRGPTAEIVMIGSRAGISANAIPGHLVYLSGGNAWVMEETTSNRRLLVNTSDLDGRVFSLSPDARYLLFTRRSSKPADKEINSLWAVPVALDSGPPISLKASNVVHFAAWYPDQSAAVAYSTVEPRANAPGWQANNDLYRTSLGGTPARILDAQSGGVYGWWGTNYAFSPNGRLAYARPDGIGLVSQDGGYLAPLLSIDPLQTRGDWAWTPGIAWSADSQILYYVEHDGQGSQSAEGSAGSFHLQALSLSTNASVTLAEDVGMFAAPVASPRSPGEAQGELQLAFMQAIFPAQSDVSRYRLAIMDRDGSNRRELFPPPDGAGLDPQRVIWAPGQIEGQGGPSICVIYRGDLWIVDTDNGQATQITYDGLISGVDWR